MNSTRRIGLLLALVFLLPALFFSVYELSSLNKDEKMIEDIYSKQLEAILFSVNQYSDDILGNWVSKIETSLYEHPAEDSIPGKMKDLLQLNGALRGVFMIDTVDRKAVMRTFSLERLSQDLLSQTESSLPDSTVQQLLSYKKSGFQKIQRLNIPPALPGNLHGMICILETGPKQFRVTGLYIDAELFLEDIVGPRLQTISRDQFILSVLTRGSDSTVYTTQTELQQEDQLNQGTQQPAEALTKELWVFPDYLLGIRTTGNTLQELVRERTRTNLLLLVGLDIILIVAVVLVFRNLKKEVDLAQKKSDFISNVSHEIRTPLSLISMFSETLEMDRVPTEEKKHEYYQIISKEAHRLTGIVNKILNFSQTEANKKTIHFERLNLTGEIKSILETYDFHLSNKGFEYTLAAQGDWWIKGDKEAVTECIINLIDNAMKYSPDKKRIEITTGTENGFAYISFRDFGVGISKKDLKYIFDKFYRVSSGNLAKSRGTGLGLSLVKQLMDAQKGKITVDSEIGKGSTFTLYFPLD
ncbi:MAG TPA: HAMP domain-containing sensor histidine kinase [Cyclobacteriaceae bacterium]|nr:HAMP domain-containing sensor histidine kinase [Cyclobacteriaceae bacterium]